MANLLTITKEANDYFTFVLNGDIVNAVKNTRNDLLTVGNECHFKTSQGANLIKEQKVLYGNITIIDGVTLLIPVSVDDLFTKLISVGFFDWINGTGSGGVDRFDDLLDTFEYFGKDGQGLRVNEAELKLEPYVLPDVSKLDAFPLPLEALKMLRVNAEGTAYEFITQPAGSVLTVTGAMVDNTDPLNPIINHDDTKADKTSIYPQIIDGIAGTTAGFTVGQTVYALPAGAKCIDVYLAHTKQYKITPNNGALVNRWSQIGDNVTLTKASIANNYVYIEYIL